ncbi:MAG: S-layer homology domain-containing protein [Candidatus Peribacteraceae bacterium]|nr:S-layer homology domain-containing protein [Candidatus Peribacteraceae bacterium]MDD5742454.1 S-layer homology domain-containing protein [Candidatus Peribacteraceae bacterium]
MKNLQRFLAGILALSVLLPSISLAAETTAFKDVPAGSPVAEAAEYLRSVGVLSGYPDPSDPSGQAALFRPDQKVNRAESIKIIIAPLLKPEALTQLTSTPFSDIKTGDWYLPYVEAARQNSIVDGPPAKTAFNGTKPVTKMEFIKMILLAYRIDPNSYSEISLPLSSDVIDPTAWFYPYLRYALTASMTMVTSEGTFDPGRELTRGDTALILYRFLMYRNGKRTQALLSESESEILIVLGSLKDNNPEQAEYASARALLAARGANAGAPNQPLVQGALKITEAFRAIVRAYRAGINQQFDESIRLCGDAWNLATRAKELSPGLANLSDQVQALAKNLADSARTAKAGPASP